MHTNPTALQLKALPLPILLIGSGRAAQHLQYWNNLLETPHRLLCWDRSQNLQLLNSYLNQCTSVWLAITDSAIQSFYNEHLRSPGPSVIHFSGALSDDRFLCAHPLMSFPKTLLPDEVYAKIHFVISGTKTLNEVLPGFKNKFTVLNTEHKAFYHALCVLAGNFPQLLWNEVIQETKKLNLPVEALDHYIKQITENFLILKEQAITGPIARNDYDTIEKNISSLSHTPKLKSIYTTFVKEFSK